MAVVSTIVWILLAVSAAIETATLPTLEDAPAAATAAHTLPSRADYPYDGAAKKFYKLHRSIVSWDNARDTCRREGAELAYPKTQQEQEALYAIQRGLSHEEQTVYLWTGPDVGWSILSEETLDIPHEPLAFGTYLTPNGIQITSDSTANLPFVCEISEAAACNASVPGYALGPDAQRCYKLHLTGQPWLQALVTCVKEGSQLAIINSQEEADHLAAVVKAAPVSVPDVYLGFHDIFVENNFVTVDGLPLASTGYEQWGLREPNDLEGNEDCGSMLPNGRLNDIPCDKKTPFICEKQATAPRPIRGIVVE